MISINSPFDASEPEPDFPDCEICGDEVTACPACDPEGYAEEEFERESPESVSWKEKRRKL